jgi:large subunit ribosomal protein L9
MKIILTENVIKLGIEGDVKNVSDGYARNFLIPKGVAVLATKQNLALWEKKRKEIEARLAREKADKEELGKKLGELNIAIKVDAGESGKLFGSVTSADIVNAVRDASGIEVDKRGVDLPENIKGIGSYEVSIKLHPEVVAKVKVEVLPRE